MISYDNINSVARYERITLLRSWFFRIFGILALLLLAFMNFGLFGNQRSAWANRAIAANIPYINVLLINAAQAIIAIFLASDFLKRDKKLDTTETIYSRPISNGEYVIGKTLGIFYIFFGMVILVLLMSLVFNLVKEDTPIVWQAYLLYPLLITIPTIIYILGLSFMAMILIKNQPVTFILLLGYIGLTLFFLSSKLYGSLDYMAFKLPMMYSDFIGFSDPGKIFFHRIAYLFLGFAFIFATIRWINRLPQTGRWNSLNTSLFLIFLILGTFSGYQYYRLNKKTFINREKYLAINQKLSSDPVPDIIANNLVVDHQGNQLDVSCELIVANHSEKEIDTLNICLNPGFKDLRINSEGKLVNYIREGHVIRIIPETPLGIEKKISLQIVYSGTTVEDVCYLDISDENLLRERKIMVANIGKRYGILSPDYVLLTPEILWYPIAGITYNSVTLTPQKLDFASFSLDVTTKRGLEVFSQGKKAIAENGTFRFRPETELKGLSLIIGPYQQTSVKIDSLDLTLAIMQGHDFFSGQFSHIKDTIPALITEYKHRYEVEVINLKYPFKRAALIEVPVQFHAYQRNLSELFETVQPEMFLMPEKGSGLATVDFKRFQFNENFRNRREDQVRTPEEIERDILRRFVERTFFVENARSFGGMQGNPMGQVSPPQFRGGSFLRNPYSAFPQYYSFKTGFISAEFPMFNSMFEVYFNEGFSANPGMNAMAGMTDVERANLTIRDYSMEKIISQLTLP